MLSYFSDETSRFIFKQRALYTQTGDSRHISHMCEQLYQTRCGTLLKTQIEQSQKQLVVAFGCGAIGNRTAAVLSGMNIEVDFFCDNSTQKWGTYCGGKEVLSPQQLQQLREKAFVIVTTSIPAFMQQIKEQLRKLGLEQRNIAVPCEAMGRQYFDFPHLRRRTNHVFVDAGCFNGDDCLEFIRWSEGRYDRIFAFEPDAGNYANCRKRLSGYEDVSLIPHALWSKEGVSSFASDQSGSSHVDLYTGAPVVSVTLDQQLQDIPVTYIKMDIEGAELEALKGARQTISAYHPQLAICVYHKPDDIYEIPRFLHEVVPQYRFYLRHYSLCELETVLYATVE